MKRLSCGVLLTVFMGFLVSRLVYGDWPMLAANPQRTSAVLEEVRGDIGAVWYRPIEPCINYKIQVIAADNKVFMSTAKGLYCLDANNGDIVWVYATEVPLGHSPTYYNGKVYVGSYDGTIHCIDVTGANAGKKTSGWNPAVALAGFETNPLVVDAGQGVRIYAGSRDGYFYCLDVNTGALIWRYKTGGAIRLSAAMDTSNVIYFAADDLIGYAIRDNGTTYQEVWKSAKMLGAAFSSYWPVIYDEWVLFSGSIGFHGMGQQLSWSDKDDINADLTANTGTEPGPWVTGTVTMDASPICQYYEQKPFRRRVFMLYRSNGQEYTYDSDDDGNPEYAPFTWSGTTQSGSKYPPVVGNDGVLYTDIDTLATASMWTPCGALCGWNIGTQYISRVMDWGGKQEQAADEPMAFSIGGDLAYWMLCCDRECGSFDVTIPFGQPNRWWSYWGYAGRWSMFPNYQPMYPGEPPGDMDGWGTFGSALGVYAKHGVQNPFIPYNGKLYRQMGNCVMAMSPGSSASNPLPMATIVPVTDSAPAVSPAELKQRLEEEIQKMITAGHLKPGLHVSNIGDGILEGNNNNPNYEYLDMDHGTHHFSNPGETIYTLAIALPHLSTSLQNDVKTYMQTEMVNYPIDSITHVGFTEGTFRQAGEIPPDSLSEYSFGKMTTVTNNWPWDFPMLSFYAAWKYAEIFPGEATTLYNNMSSKITVPCKFEDDHLAKSPHMLNAYLAGYFGYLELEKLASQPESTNVRNEYDRLLNLLDNFSVYSPHKPGETGGMDYGQGFIMARHFLYLVPEVAQELRNRSLSAVQQAVDRINYVTPYWFVSKYDSCIGEGSLQHFYDVSVFNGLALVMQEPYEELIKYLDAPGFIVGDLFYIQNLVHTIESVPLAPTMVVVEANPVAITADGSSTSEITGRITDDAGRTVTSSNATITFSLSGTAGGTLIGTNPQQAQGGIAIITYQSGTVEGTATITGTSNGLTQGSVNVNTITNDPPNAPTNLLCNGQNNPTDLADFTPDLSWTFSDPDVASGDTQGAYRILVADSLINIDGNNGNIWDTNKVTSADTSVAYGGATLQAMGQYWWKVMVWDSFDIQGPYSSAATFTMTDIDPRAYYGVPFALPAKIEVEDFDLGGEGVAYHDSDTVNSGNQYRTNEGVDIESCSDTGSGYNIGWTVAGEWLEYTVNVSAPGTYRVDVRVASAGIGGSFHIEFNGSDKTGALSIPDTSGWQNWQTVSKSGVSLDAGKQIMRFVMDTNGPGGYVSNLNYIYIETETVTPTITVTLPNGGETWTINTQQTVTWNSGGTVGNINIDLSTDGGSNWTSLASNTANDGTETITVPDSQSTTCRIRVQDVGGSPSDTSDNNFTIAPPPQAQITVTAPNGGETWQVGSQHAVTWTSQGNVGNAVGIDLSTDGGSNWSSLVSGTTNDGSQTIAVPNSPSTTCKIRVQDVSGTPTDTSNSNFTIEESPDPEAISVTSATLDFGEVEIGKKNTLDFVITNTGGGTLSGSISTTKKWIQITPTSFSGNNVTISVTVDNSILSQPEGEYTGTISITSNGGNIDVEVTLVATCVLAKPNPYDPSKGNLTFFGDGIVAGETVIRIYTLSGELIKTLPSPSFCETETGGQAIAWDGKNENGTEVTNGIYIYVYESPKEKGVAKFTVIR